MSAFNVTVRTISSQISYVSLARSASGALMDAMTLFGDVPCGITVMARV
jgi:hypothetical protein